MPTGNWGITSTTIVTVDFALGTYTATNAWNQWANQWTVTANQETWQIWNGNYAPISEPTAEQRAETELRRVVWEADQAARREKAQQAVERARQLFHEALTPDQRAEVETHRYFTVYGGKTKRQYRVRTDTGRHGNIEELDAHGKPVRRYCVAPSGSVPEHDAFVGQKLFIEHDEDEFLAKANVTQLRRTA